MNKKSINVTAKVYDTQAKNFVFPEDNLEELKGKESLGICFSGGGTRSASLTLGQLRALDKIGVLERAKYMCGVSGGSWGSLPFIYLDKNIGDSTFLGEYLAPSQITLNNLKQTPKNSMANAISNSKILKDTIIEALKLRKEGKDDPRDLYSLIVADIMLKPFNIGEHNKFFTYNEQTRDEILNQNKGFKKDDFYLVNPNKNRPYYIAQGIVGNYSHADLLPSKQDEKLAPKTIERHQFEMTPLYVGVNQLFKPTNITPNAIGGGYVQPHGFNSNSPVKFDSSTKLVQTTLDSKNSIFHLGEIIGISGAAPAVYSWICDLVNKLFKVQLFPNQKYWCNFSNPTSAVVSRYDFADGGGLENLGIMPLLKRGVKKIIVFSNCETELKGSNESNKEITNSIPALFYALKDNYGQEDFKDNIVFANQKGKYEILVKALMQKNKDGLPPIFVDKYQVTPQPCYGIEGNYEVEIMWVYNSKCSKWYNQLSKEVQDLITGKKEFSNFPFYKTFMQNPPHIIDLTPEQVNLEAHLSSWGLIESIDELKKFAGITTLARADMLSVPS